MNADAIHHRRQHLLSLAGTIRHYEDALAKANGERFNLFDILHVGHYEVRTHSPMLAELLNPKGSHGQGAVFLQHFLTALEIFDFDAASARAVPEAPIGDLGRLDIEITDRYGHRILIENKIHAGLQSNQLGRYHEYDRNASLLFLTLEGGSPADWTTNPVYKTESFKKVYQNISYRTDVVRWLENCRKEATTAPGVREAITQYIHLILRLTQQNTSAQMNQEILKAVTSDSASYLAYASLRNEQWNVKMAIIAKANTLLETIGGELGLKTVQKFDCQGKQYDNYFFTTDELAAQNLLFGFECQSSDYRDFCFGFSWITPGNKRPIESHLIARFKLSFPFNEKKDTNDQWPAANDWNQHRNWNDDDTLAAIISGEFADELKAVVEKLAKIGADAIKASAVPAN